MPPKCSAFSASRNSIHLRLRRTKNASCSDQLQKSLQSFQPFKRHHGKHALASRVRRSLSHRVAEDSPSCAPRLLLALCSNWMQGFTCRVGFAFSFFGKSLLLLLFLLLVRLPSSGWLLLLP